MTPDYITPEQYIPGTIYNIPELKRQRGNARGYKRRYKDVLCAFDIETATLPPELTGLEKPQSSMYMWQICIYEHCIIVGRTWEQFLQLLTIIDDELEDDHPEKHKTPLRLVWFVHNLSYEFQFLKGLFHFENEAVFCLDSHKILRADLTPHIELRCSYLHSNMSLAMFLDKMHAEHRKMSGADFDYKAVRYPWTPLTDEQIRYGVHDVLGLCEALRNEMQTEGDNLHTLPLTSTGYVRRDIKKAMNKLTRVWLPETLPPLEVYTMLREAFRGGDTHANRHFSGRVLENVHSADRSSSYPGVQMNCKFPCGAWNIEPHPSEDVLHNLIHRRHRAVVFRATYHNVRLRTRWEGCPYIPKDKCIVHGSADYDNGRILHADEITITQTDIDYAIMRGQYIWDSMEVLKIAYSAYKYLPEEMKAVIRKYYTMKTELKQDEHSPTFDPVRDVLYTKAKNKLNSIYGCSAQQIKPQILFANGEYIPEETPLETLMEQSYKHAFFSYAWGVWTTAHARNELHRGIRLIQSTPEAFFIYCDTDSCKYIGAVDWSAYNAEKQELSTKTGACAADPSGVTHYMEVFENDGEYSKFAALSSKKYAFLKPGKPGTQITIAGVTKKLGGAELDRGDKYGSGIERFAMASEPGKEFLFREAGGTAALYNDNIDTTLDIDGHSLRITDNVVILDSTYLLGTTAEYSTLVQIEQLNRIDPELYYVNNWDVG